MTEYLRDSCRGCGKRMFKGWRYGAEKTDGLHPLETFVFCGSEKCKEYNKKIAV